MAGGIGSSSSSAWANDGRRRPRGPPPGRRDPSSRRAPGWP
ncbi:hypothetical protein ACRAWD_06290 [Caulobacter segnis]